MFTSLLAIIFLFRLEKKTHFHAPNEFSFTISKKVQYLNVLEICRRTNSSYRLEGLKTALQINDTKHNTV